MVYRKGEIASMRINGCPLMMSFSKAFFFFYRMGPKNGLQHFPKLQVQRDNSPSPPPPCFLTQGLRAVFTSNSHGAKTRRAGACVFLEMGLELASKSSKSEKEKKILDPEASETFFYLKTPPLYSKLLAPFAFEL